MGDIVDVLKGLAKVRIKGGHTWSIEKDALLLGHYANHEKLEYIACIVQTSFQNVYSRLKRFGFEKPRSK